MHIPWGAHKPHAWTDGQTNTTTTQNARSKEKVESTTMHKQALVLSIFVSQRGYNSLWSRVWRCPAPVRSLKCLTLDQCLRNTAALSLSCNENSDALKSSKILLCIVGHLLQIPIRKLRLKKRLSLYYVQQTSILKVSRCGLTSGKKRLHFFPEL